MSGSDRPRIGEDAISRRRFVRLGGIAGAGALLGSPLLAACGSSDSSTSAKPSGPDGLTKVPTTPFRPSASVGEKPKLPKRMAVLLPDTAEIWDAVDKGFKLALADRGLEHTSASAGGDPAKAVQQFNTVLARGVGAVGVFAVDPNTQKPVLQRSIGLGVGTFTGVMAPATCQVATDQFALGKFWGQTAGRYIAGQLGGTAEVVILNEDAVPSLKPRHQGILAGLKATAPNAKIVADEPFPGTQEKSFKTAKTILAKNPNANVWLAGDPGVLGALAALESANKVNDKVALFGSNGDPEALKSIQKGGPIKATLGFAFPPLTYAMGQFAADWLAGKTIPQVIYAKPFLIDSADRIAAFQRGSDAPQAAFQAGGGDYYNLSGSISYETRNRYLKVYA